MISSMTGFGKGAVSSDNLIIETEIKSFNSRFLDLSLKIPRNLSDKEFLIRDIIKKNVKRGKVTLSIFFKREGTDNKPLFIDKSGLASALEILNELKSSSETDDKISLDNILLFQNMFLTDTILNVEDEYHLVEKSIKKALENFKEMRIKEGIELTNDLKTRVGNIQKTVVKISSANRPSVDSYFNKLKNRAMQLFEDLESNAERLDFELAILAEKFDITEECVRLDSHIKMFLNTLDQSEEAGRKLNFIAQEMNREANTINSKTISTEISHLGIFIKEELEKVREQIQNIE